MYWPLLRPTKAMRARARQAFIAELYGFYQEKVADCGEKVNSVAHFILWINLSIIVVV